MTFKNHACCGHTFAPIDGALALQKQLGVPVRSIRHIRLATYRPALDVAGNFHPVTAAEARFSVPFVVATALLYGSVRLAAFTTERLADPAIRELMGRIELTVDPELDAAFPGQRAARVSIELDSSETHHFFQPTRHGDPEAPLSDGDLSDKFRELVNPVLGESRAAQLLERLWRLEQYTQIIQLKQ